MTRLLPNRCTQMALSGAAIMIVAACGSSTAPAFTVEYPSTDWRYCVIKKSMPNSEKNEIMIAPLATLNRGFWKKCTLSIGLGVCNSHTRKPASRPAPSTNATSTSGEVQPCDGASMTPQRKIVRPEIDRTAPTGSRRGADGSRESGTSR